MNKADIYTKSVLTIIAMALVVICFRLGTPNAHADDEINQMTIVSMASEVDTIQKNVSTIENDLYGIEIGNCQNQKICGF